MPAVVAVRRALNNKPYRNYLAMKFPISLVSLMPVNMIPYFLRCTAARMMPRTSVLAARRSGPCRAL